MRHINLMAAAFCAALSMWWGGGPAFAVPQLPAATAGQPAAAAAVPPSVSAANGGDQKKDKAAIAAFVRSDPANRGRAEGDKRLSDGMTVAEHVGVVWMTTSDEEHPRRVAAAAHWHCAEATPLEAWNFKQRACTEAGQARQDNQAWAIRIVQGELEAQGLKLEAQSERLLTQGQQLQDLAARSGRVHDALRGIGCEADDAGLWTCPNVQSAVEAAISPVRENVVEVEANQFVLAKNQVELDRRDSEVLSHLADRHGLTFSGGFGAARVGPNAVGLAVIGGEYSGRSWFSDLDFQVGGEKTDQVFSMALDAAGGVRVVDGVIQFGGLVGGYDIAPGYLDGAGGVKESELAGARYGVRAGFSHRLNRAGSGVRLVLDAGAISGVQENSRGQFRKEGGSFWTLSLRFTQGQRQDIPARYALAEFPAPAAPPQGGDLDPQEDGSKE